MIVYLFFSRQTCLYDRYIDGFWEASTKFCGDSGLKMAAAYFNPNEKTVYIIMEKEDGTLILNKIFVYKFSGSFFSPDDHVITFDEDMDLFPKKCNIKINLATGEIVLYDEDTIYLKLYKNSKATAGTV